MVAASGANIAAVAVERIVNRVDLSDARLLMLSQSFADFGEKTRLLMALVGERCLTYPVFDRPQTLNRDYYDRLPPRAVLEAYNALGLAARDGIAYLDCVQERMGVLRLPMCQYRDAAETAQARWFPRKRSILRRQIGYGTGIVAREAVYVAPREMARVLLAVERYRLVHGSLPEAIDSLVPEHFASVPEDPLDGMPLRYKRLDRGYVIYSVGEDRRDNGGKPRPPEDGERHYETWDVVFQVQR